ncbi:hypothetical protein LTR91_014911 [Friedmanniomyces endolithicus]|uniref:Uncharacterized protein n=1 Tax=Friedmanniomyces endolithicus TaxID=329885 RepID=A0A4U0UYK3_9PEZI|nr:hypothetical protein LTS09_013469 [Friedmanniomyces endolithicus]KAK0268550.1 hypothetical protein LTR35_015437 [Friedmanniomyces endolithicus]KAK0286546.1 hypothetical protein LTS00_010484 [Friedmanniomyces endolithicus]KAK0303465.1 hypothetical protein LTR01_008020 [Friedmanniomyces endolithicus]KAK0317156.1 hypothetical protein LTR82_011757 [Friedmanniomyces endolithicus]
MAPTLAFDLSAISAQLTALLQSCIEKVCESVKAEADSERALRIKAEGNDIEGLREQILANATILLPLLRPDAIMTITVNGKREAFQPKLHVIVSGQPNGKDAYTQAYVVYDQDGTSKKAKFLYTKETSVTAAGALQKLLGVSAQLIEQNLFGNTFNLAAGHPMPVTGGGWCSPGGQHSPLILPSDLKFWGKSMDSAPSTPGLSSAASSPNPSFNSDSSFGSSGSAYAEAVDDFCRRGKRGDNFVGMGGGVAPGTAPVGSGGRGAFHGMGFNRSFASNVQRPI